MNQMFFGNSRVMIFNLNSGGGSAPVARTATRVWYGNDESVYTDYEISGTIEGISGPMGYESTTQIPRVEFAKKIEIGSAVTSIGEGAFYECTNLTSVMIPDGVTSIGYQAFYGCSGLTNVTIPDSVTNIENNIFQNCYELTNIIIILTGKPNANAVNVRQMLIDSNYDENFNNIFWIIPDDSIRTATRVSYNKNDLNYADFEIEGTITNDGDGPFGYEPTAQITDIWSATKIKFGSTVSNIGTGAFCNCSNLAHIIIPNTVLSLGDNAFEGCIGLKSITIPDSIAFDGFSTFYNCSSITGLTVTITANGGNAEEVRMNMEERGIPVQGVTWNMPS